MLKGATGTWKLRVVAAAPWQLFVYRQWLVPGRAQELLAIGATDYTFAATDPFRLTASLTDSLGRKVVSQLEIETFADHPPKATDEFVHLIQFMNGPRQAEVHVQMAEATSLRLGVYDIRGRERALLANDVESRGERVIRWNAGTLEPGIYFLRATTGTHHTAVLRFVVIR